MSLDDFSGGLRLRAKRVMSLEEARTGLAESLRLKVAGEQLAGDRLGWLAELCGRHRGACPLTLDYRGENARRLQVAGTGLGLTIVRSVVEAHGGVVSLESTPGEGTSVCVLLPR